MISMGHHCILNVYGCNPKILDNEDFMVQVLTKAAGKCGATILNTISHKFEPQGLTAMLLLSESHITVHTFPEKFSAAFDIYTCGDANSKVGVQWILQQLNAEYHTLIDIGR